MNIQYILPALICFLPLIISLFIFKLSFNVKIKYMIFAIILGLIAVIPISFIQFFLPEDFLNLKNPMASYLVKSLVIYGLVEEIFKTILIIPLPKKHNTPLQFLFISFIFGLSLGCFESVVYFVEHLQASLRMGGQILYVQIFIRIFTSDLIQMCCAGLAGLFIYGCFHKTFRLSYLVFAILIHGLYDFFVPFQLEFTWLRLFAIPVILLAILECRVKYTDLLNKIEDSQ